MGKEKSRKNHAQKTDPLESILERGIERLRRGDLAAASPYFRQILSVDPQHIDALQLLAIVEFQQSRFAAAAELLQKALDLAPDEAGLHCNLGLALHQLGRLEPALASHERALALNPDFAEALNNRGNILRELARLDEAAASYQRAIGLRPDFAEALHNLGLTLLALHQPEPALASLAACLQLAPHNVGAHGQYGMALMALKRPDAALACFDRVLERAPDDAEAHYWRGNALIELGRPDDALASYRRAARIRPDLPEIHYNLANLLVDLKRHDEALDAFDRALELRPDYAPALYNRGGTLQELRRHDAAAASYERLVAQKPDYRHALGKLFHCRQQCADWTRHAEHLAELVGRDNPARDLPFSFLGVSADAALQLQCARAYTASHFPASPTPLWNGQRYRHDRLRLAYVSADFRAHPLCYLLAGVFEAHDRARFETIAVALAPLDACAVGGRVEAAFDRVIDASTMSDTEVAALLRELEVDIAVDLMGYTENNRTAIFAQRPAPIQVNYLGFPGTMGADYIDYIIADEFVIPDDARQHYAEHVAYLPECFQGNDDRRAIAEHRPSRGDVGLPDAAFVFCAFNAISKLTPDFFAIWMRLLRQIPHSVLWLASDDPVVDYNLRAEAQRHGVAAQRLVFSPRLAYADHLARLPLADLFLDTLPFNAGTTASDALWAGVPVLTCAGEAFAARMAASLLRAVGLDELIAAGVDDYATQALDLATSPQRLAAIRSRLGERRATHPLFATERFCRHLEAAYLGMRERQQRGEPPACLRIAALE